MGIKSNIKKAINNNLKPIHSDGHAYFNIKINHLTTLYGHYHFKLNVIKHLLNVYICSPNFFWLRMIQNRTLSGSSRFKLY